ncbi:hypothetical protein BWI97_07260 [Siphonobacter sp. BAB-5405]|uniref:hypothetical protein n=1 Tax=Siphonobacter sp. BAB-5405 TaxID=1864825 RepID=UPI000C8029E5|nr:hypothetical protein [Siphonobacter sp. BAB-5405]PMD97421.1 hypothetical protein BWI97_07260 [Siphonobacter sp. BAB-5405]
MADSPKHLNPLIDLEAEIDRQLPDGNNQDIKPQHLRETIKTVLRRYLRPDTKVILLHEGVPTPYSSYYLAYLKAVAGDMIILQDNLTERLYPKNGVNVNGNGFSVIFTGSAAIQGELSTSNCRAAFYNFDTIKTTGDYAITMGMANSTVYIQARRIEANDQTVEIWSGSTKLTIDAEEIISYRVGGTTFWTGDTAGELTVRGARISGPAISYIGSNATFIECTMESPSHAYWGAGAPSSGVIQKLIRCNLTTDLVRGAIRTAGAITLILEDTRIKCKGLVSNAASDNTTSAVSHDCSGPLLLRGVNIVQAFQNDCVYSKTRLLNMGRLLANKPLHGSSSPCLITSPEVNAAVEL